MQKIITKINKFTNHTPGPHPDREFDRIQQFEWHGRKKAKQGSHGPQADINQAKFGRTL